MVKNVLSYHRVMNNRVRYNLAIEQWIKDVPLPSPIGYIFVWGRENSPFMDIILEENQTVQQYLGFFVESFATVEEALAWHKQEMEKVGWVKNKEILLPASASIQYCDPNNPLLYTEINLQYHPNQKELQAIIRRVHIQPWQPVL